MQSVTSKQKGFTLVEIMIVVVIIGLLAALAVPSFRKVRAKTNENVIKNNLRQIANAGQQYLLETGKTRVSYDILMREGYFRTIKPVKEENYRSLIVLDRGGKLDISYKTSGSPKNVTYEY